MCLKNLFFGYTSNSGVKFGIIYNMKKLVKTVKLFVQLIYLIFKPVIIFICYSTL